MRYTCSICNFATVLRCMCLAVSLTDHPVTLDPSLSCAGISFIKIQGVRFSSSVCEFS